MQMNWSFIYAPLAWEVSLRKPDYWRAVCYGALTKSNWSACKCEVIQLSHFPSPLQASSWHLPRPRYEYKWRTQAWVLSPFLPTNNSNLHPGAKWTSMRTFQSPRPRSVPPYLPSSHSAGPGERGTYMSMTTFGRTDPRKRPKQDLPFAKDGLGVRGWLQGRHVSLALQNLKRTTWNLLAYKYALGKNGCKSDCILFQEISLLLPFVERGCHRVKARVVPRAGD